MRWFFLWGRKMPLPNIQKFIGTDVTQQGFKNAQADLLVYINEMDARIGSTAAGYFKSYQSLSDANADIVNIPFGVSVRVLSSIDGGDYYKASASATNLTKSAYDPVEQAKQVFLQNLKISNITNTAEKIQGYAVSSDLKLVQSPNVLTMFIPVESGDVIEFKGALGSGIVGELIHYALLFDEQFNLVGPIYSYTSTGVIIETNYSSVASQRGYVCLRIRSDRAYQVSLNSKVYKEQGDNSLKIEADNYSFSEYEIGYVINADGTRTNTSDTAWRNYYIPVSKGDRVNCFCSTGDGSTGIDISFVAFMRNDRTFVSNLKTCRTNAALNVATASVEAPNDGLIYIRAKVGIQPKIFKISQEFLAKNQFKDYFDDQLASLDDISDAPYDTSYIYDIGGIKVNVNQESGWRSYFIDCNKGDKFTYDGIVGSGVVGQEMLYMAQFDGQLNYVEAITTYISEGSQSKVGRIDGVASRTGKFYIRARSLGGSNVKITKESKIFASNGDVSSAHTRLDEFEKELNLVGGQLVDTVSEKVDEALSSGVEQIITPIIDDKILGIAGDVIESGVSDAIAASGIASLTRLDSQLERLPVNLSNDHGYNFVPYSQNNIVTFDDYQYVVAVDHNRDPILLQRYKLGAWKTFNLGLLDGNPFAAPNYEDSHNNFVVTVTASGKIMVSGNHHNNVCRCVVSENAHDIESWNRVFYTQSNAVTYPRLLRYPDGTVQAFWREGSSGNGAYYASIWDDQNNVFNAKRMLIDQASTVTSNPYEQCIGIGVDGSLHLCWGYRTNSASADTNFGMFYAKSNNKGLSWTSASGAQNFELPLNDVRSERIFNAPPSGGYVNQNGGCCDKDGRYHTVITQYDSNNKTQIVHIWFDGSAWRSDWVTDFDFHYSLTANMVTADLSRPLVACTRNGKTFVLYHTNYMGRGEQIRCIDVTNVGAPVGFCLAKFNTRNVELSINVDYVMRDHEFVMLLSRGGGDRTNEIWKNQPGYLLTAPLPI